MLKVAKAALLLLIVSLPFTKHSIAVGGLAATPTELIFLVMAAAFGAALVGGSARLRWHKWLWILPLYWLATGCSALLSDHPAAQAMKLASNAYLVALPFFVAQLIDDEADFHRALHCWLGATAVTAGLGLVTVIGFALGVDRAWLDYALHGYGTLAPGNYPRLETTFTHPAMLCNYLTASLAILLLCRQREWVGGKSFASLLAAILVTAMFTITPGLGGIVQLLAAWWWLQLRDQRPRLAAVLLAGGSAAALAFVAAAAVTPILYPGAPFLVAVPGTSLVLAGAVRALAWGAATTAFFQHPLIGGGVGTTLLHVLYVAPSGMHHVLDDAHNVYLNVAMHSGLLGLAALLALIALVARRIGPLDRATSADALLAFAWLDAFAYQGLTGSYEDARHLWVLLGLVMVAGRASRSTSGADDPGLHPQ